MMDTSQGDSGQRCYQCGAGVRADTEFCELCGAPVVHGVLAGAAAISGAAPLAPAVVAAGSVPVTGLPPAPVAGPTLSVGPAPAVGPTLSVGPPPVGGGGFAFGRNGRVVLAAVAALIVVIGGVAVVLRLTAPTPESTVEDYFAALADGDSARALALVGDVELFGEQPLLSDAALADRRLRPSDVEIGATQEIAAGFESLAGRSVQVTYRIGAETVQQTVYVTEAEDVYRLAGPFAGVSVSDAAGRPISVNGVAVNGTDAQIVAFPGAYQITVAGGALWAEESVRVVPSDGPYGALQAVASFERPTLAPTALQTIDREVRAALDACATSTAPAPPGCPFDVFVWGSEVTVNWSITRYPGVAATPARRGGVSLGDDGSGVAHYEMTYKDWSGENRTESGDEAIRIYGSAVETGAGLAVTLD